MAYYSKVTKPQKYSPNVDDSSDSDLDSDDDDIEDEQADDIGGDHYMERDVPDNMAKTANQPRSRDRSHIPNPQGPKSSKNKKKGSSKW